MIARTIISVALAAMIALFAAAPADAQRTGTRIGSNASKANPEEVLQVAAECAAKRRPAYALNMLQELPGSEEEFRILRRGEGDLGACMNSSQRLAVGSVILSGTPLAFRLALVEEMVKERLTRSVDASALSGGEPWFYAKIPAGATEIEADARYITLMEFGDCVVSSAPAQSIAFVSAEKESPAEQAALQGLIPFLGPCIAAGQEITITPVALHQALNEPLYHRMLRADQTS